jgi:SAM-dependent methyltransferase
MPSPSNDTFPRPRILQRVRTTPTRSPASAYDHVGDAYGGYADGDAVDDPGAVSNRFAHADTIVWRAIRATIDDLRASGVSTLRVLDAGCGPGTWITRIAAHANRLGLAVEAVGFDIAHAQLEIARNNAASLKTRCHEGSLQIEFLNHDLSQPLPWCDAHFHIVLCNYVVLNHVPRDAVARAVEELCRVASHRVVATVRALGSPATACIIGQERVREYHQDCARGELKLALKDGTEHRFTFNLYGADVLRLMFAPHATIVELRAVDLFVSRFAADPHWTASLLNGLAGRQEVLRNLGEIEETLCRQPGWIDHGTHVLIVGQPKVRASRV